VARGQLVGLRRVWPHRSGSVVEQRLDLVEWQPDRPVHQHEVQPFDVGIGVAAVTGGGTDARHDKTDVVVVVQRADGDTREGGYRADGLV